MVTQYNNRWYENIIYIKEMFTEKCCKQCREVRIYDTMTKKRTTRAEQQVVTCF